MKKWPPSSPSSGKSIRRNHSPFCESTGPIVQEGFVAARIRILQGLQAQALVGNRSHSPMIPCPPETGRHYEPGGSLRCGVRSIQAANDTFIVDDGKPTRAREVNALREQERRGDLSTGDDYASTGLSTMSPNSKNEKAELDSSTRHTRDASKTLEMTNNSGSTKRTRRYTSSATSSESIKVTTRTPSCSQEPDVSEPEIFGPRPISSSLANASTLSNCFRQSDRDDNRRGHEYEYSDTQRLPRKSVADNLGSLVECEGFESSYTNHIDDSRFLPYGTSATARPRDRKLYKETSSVDHEPKLSEAHIEQNIPSSTMETGSICRESPEHRSLRSDRSEIGIPLYSCRSGQRKLSKPHRCRDSNNSSFQRSSSDAQMRTADTLEFSSIGSRRAWSVGNSHRHSGGNTEAIELDNFSGNEAAANDTCGKERNIAAKQSLHEVQEPRLTDEGSVPEQKGYRKPSVSASLGPSSRRSSTTRSKSHRSATRSTSWFRRSWFNPFGGDERSVVEEPSPDAPIRTSASRTTQPDQKDFFPFPEQPAQDNLKDSSIVGHDYDGRSTDLTNSPQRVLQMPGSHEEKAVPGYRVDISDRANEARQPSGHSWIPRESMPVSHRPAADYQTVAEIPEYAKSSSGSSQVSVNSRSITVPVRQSSKKAPTSPSKAASLVSTGPHGKLLSERRKLDEALASHRPSQQGSSSDSIRMHRSSRDSLVASRSSNAERAPESKAGSSHQQPHQPHVDYIQRGLKARGRGIKRIQVIISFDGADDLVIEAGADFGGAHWVLGG